ncbi:MAG TPA: adenylate/guanylate cyclase domain-containing response regulator [Gammaproteobacteria bacterium]|nr:adenylate/guanylate cyclase domain-containing response regulator [Gammaproteobacteria bacterium]
MSKSCNILAVDDDALNRGVIERIVARKGHKVTLANDGKDALHQIRRGAFDLVLLDVMMPGIDGSDVLREIRHHYSMSDLPVIMVSALSDSDKVVELLELGANDYVTKPIDAKVLQARVKTQLSVVTANKKVFALSEDAKRRNKLLLNLFGRYVTEDVVRNLVSSPEGSKIGSELEEVTLLFADIRGFSNVTERLSPEHVLTVLNNYYDVMIDVVNKFKGTIDKLMGDEMLVTFGVPKTRNDDAERALACALSMQLAMSEVNERNRAQRLPELQLGIGVNTGEVMVGNVGSDKHASFSVVGKEVNLTASIEAHAKGGEILISEAVFMGSGVKVWTDGKRELRPKGFSHGIMVYRLTGMDGKYKRSLNVDETRENGLSPALSAGANTGT